jgi:predicted NUDIX family NTP pyrophosphohydrolase
MEPGLVYIAGRPFPEIDRVAWMTPDQARVKLNPAQGIFVDRLLTMLSVDGNNASNQVLDQGQ